MTEPNGLYFEVSLAFLDGSLNQIPTFYDSSGNPTSEFIDASNNYYSPLQTCTPAIYKNGSMNNNNGNTPTYGNSIQVSGYFYNPNITPALNNSNGYAKTWISSGYNYINNYTNNTSPPIVTIIAVRIA